MNGRGERGSVCASTVTWRSSIASSSADWVFGDARLISSASTTLAKIATGPELELVGGAVPHRHAGDVGGQQVGGELDAVPACRRSSGRSPWPATSCRRRGRPRSAGGPRRRGTPARGAPARACPGSPARRCRAGRRTGGRTTSRGSARWRAEPRTPPARAVPTVPEGLGRSAPGRTGRVPCAHMTNERPEAVARYGLLGACSGARARPPVAVADRAGARRGRLRPPALVAPPAVPPAPRSRLPPVPPRDPVRRRRTPRSRATSSPTSSGAATAGTRPGPADGPGKLAAFR